MLLEMRVQEQCSYMSRVGAITVSPLMTKVVCILGAADLMENLATATVTLDMSPLELLNWQVLACLWRLLLS
jgi:hypothetical protein